MSVNYAYNYAQIDLNTGRCVGVRTLTAQFDPCPEQLIPIPVYDTEYYNKYYNRADGNWYEDAAFTIPWQSSLI